MRADLLKTQLKSEGIPKNMQDVEAEAKALESAQRANKLNSDATKGIEEQVHWVSYKQMKLKRELGTCFWFLTDKDLILGKHAPQMTRRSGSVELTITSLKSSLRQKRRNKHINEEPPNEKRGSRGKSTDPLVVGPLATKASAA